MWSTCRNDRAGEGLTRNLCAPTLDKTNIKQTTIKGPIEAAVLEMMSARRLERLSTSKRLPETKNTDTSTVRVVKQYSRIKYKRSPRIIDMMTSQSILSILRGVT